MRGVDRHLDVRRLAQSRWTLVAVALVPIVTAAARATVRGWFPIGDSADRKSTRLNSSH